MRGVKGVSDLGIGGSAGVGTGGVRVGGRGGGGKWAAARAAAFARPPAAAAAAASAAASASSAATAATPPVHALTPSRYHLVASLLRGWLSSAVRVAVRSARTAAREVRVVGRVTVRALRRIAAGAIAGARSRLARYGVAIAAAPRRFVKLCGAVRRGVRAWFMAVRALLLGRHIARTCALAFALGLGLAVARRLMQSHSATAAAADADARPSHAVAHHAAALLSPGAPASTTAARPPPPSHPMPPTNHGAGPIVATVAARGVRVLSRGGGGGAGAGAGGSQAVGDVALPAPPSRAPRRFAVEPRFALLRLFGQEEA